VVVMEIRESRLMDDIGRNHERIRVVELRFGDRGDHAVFHEYYVSVDPDIQTMPGISYVAGDNLGVCGRLVDERVQPFKVLFILGLWDKDHFIEKTAVSDEISLRSQVSLSFDKTALLNGQANLQVAIKDGCPLRSPINYQGYDLDVLRLLKLAIASRECIERCWSGSPSKGPKCKSQQGDCGVMDQERN
jgi:hypothetical protein